MKIIILGAGRVGQSVADSLVSEHNDITVIDTDAERLRDLESRFDLRGVVGNGIDPQVLAEAGAKDTDLLVACAAQDETNLVCCKVAQLLFNVPTRIARVRSQGFEEGGALVGKDGFAVDRILCPEDSLTRYIGKLVEYPEALQVREFAGGR
ncbi:MAG: Trk system potassium transporter TrkA, partial [Burkholderiaceae bacterium]